MKPFLARAAYLLVPVTVQRVHHRLTCYSFGNEHANFPVHLNAENIAWVVVLKGDDVDLLGVGREHRPGSIPSHVMTLRTLGLT